MTDKEQLAQLTSYLRRLTELTEQMRETAIYPVSFFNEAFDLTNRVREQFHSIEVAQIELFDRQIREHQAQISSVERPIGRPAAATAEAVHPPVPAADEVPPVPSAAPASVSRNTALPAASPSFRDKTEPSLNDKMEKTKLTDLRKAFTLNDRFRFCRELFGGDEQRMNRVVGELNETYSYEESLAHLKSVTDWDFENDSVLDFLKLVERRFV
ncbi:hypothetical protein [Tannerella sp.]|uniref:hypothetical protein n=1 Tax=Tannerella sp. TaxID=2382127 RepID=UPI0026DCCD56|nr:hypothetical protein [Tannerella sp.]MDO4703310.1 hypothetical protein [Tannerella sp.]